MKERLKKLRKTLGLTQQEFADRIGISRGNIATYETREGSPGSSVINLICREFNVSEEWLRTGEGAMFLQRSEEDELKQAVAAMLHGRNPNFKRRLITILASLEEDEWLVLEEKVLELAEAVKPESIPSLAVLPAASSQDELERQADKFAALAREQFLFEKKQGSQASSAKESDAV